MCPSDPSAGRGVELCKMCPSDPSAGRGVKLCSGWGPLLTESLIRT
uniref:Uncharacterized protein n=1 Tax=Anguilla anguilla TaxID=7936 RepID=A0A0E9XVP5_ANGAN